MADWHAIQVEQFVPPQGGSVPELVAELVDVLSSPDPQVRDELAFSALATWIDEGVVSGDLLRSLGDTMAQRLQAEEVHARDQEDDRLAHAIGKVLTRPGLSQDDATAWLDPVDEVLSSGEPGPTPAHVPNTLRTLRMLYLLVSRGIRTGGEGVVQVAWRTAVLDRLAAVLHPVTPWMW